MAELSYCGSEVRRHDPDRFFTALFAAPARREALFALYAMNLELSRIADTVSEPMLGEIRLQWWREALDGIVAGSPRRHQAVLALAPALNEGWLSRPLLDRMIDARAADLAADPPADLATLLDYADGTGGTLAELALEVLIRDSSEDLRRAARMAGRVQALVGLMRSLPHHAGRQRLFLPTDLMESAGVSPRQLYDLKPPAGLGLAVKPVLDAAADALDKLRQACARPPRAALPAVLPARFAAIDLDALRRAGHDPFSHRAGRTALIRQFSILSAVIRGGV